MLKTNLFILFVCQEQPLLSAIDHTPFTMQIRAGREISYRKFTTKLSKLARGLSCYFIAHLLKGTMAIIEGPTVMAISAVTYFKPC